MKPSFLSRHDEAKGATRGLKASAAIGEQAAPSGLERPTERPILFSAPMVLAILSGSKTQTRRAMRAQPSEHHWQSIPGYELKRSKIVTINERCAVKFSHSIPQNREWDTALDWLLCPYGQPGDQLWVREAWRTLKQWDSMPPRDLGEGSGLWFQADRTEEDARNIFAGKLRPGMFMPRWASRIQLEITGVRAERLQSISEADAMAEGCAADIPTVWWQGYKDCGDNMGWIHQQAEGETPPAWMIEPHRMAPTPWLDRSARDHYRTLWASINGFESWDANPWVWVIEFRRILVKGAATEEARDVPCENAKPVAVPGPNEK